MVKEGGAMAAMAPAPPLVQELAGVPARYVARGRPRDDCRPAAATATIPIIDLARLRRPDVDAAAAAAEAAALRRALESWGYFLVTNHGVEEALMDAVVDASREFFRRPLDDRQRYSNLVDGERFQVEGYGNDQVRSEEQILDWCDRLYLKVLPEEDRSPALWPMVPKTFRDALHEYTTKCWGVRDALLREMAKLLGLSRDYFVDEFADDAVAFARMNYYPECPSPGQVSGIKPHSDGTVLTFLVIDGDADGLQVLRDGIWYDVPVTSHHTLLVNIGDLIEITTNGAFRSPVHRVVTSAERARLSVALFYTLDGESETEIRPAAELADGEQRPAALYQAVRFKDYRPRIFEHFATGTRAIDTVKV